MVCLDLLGLQLSARSGEEARKTSGMHCRLSNMTIVKILFRGGNRCTYAHYSIERSIFAHWVLDESGDFAILRLFLLPSMAKGSGSIYRATTEVANDFALLCV